MYLPGKQYEYTTQVHNTSTKQENTTTMKDRTSTKTVFQSALVLTCSSLFSLLAFNVQAAGEQQWSTIENFCVACHNDEDWAGSIAFNLMSPDHVSKDAEIWEHAIKKLRGGLMPPPGVDRPPEQDIEQLADWLVTTIDSQAGDVPAGNIPLRRLNRREYGYAIRDLLGLNVDAEHLLPADDVFGGYDNNAAALQVSPAFIDQYLNAARTIAHEAIGDRRPIPIMETYGNVANMIISLPAREEAGTGTQQRHNEGMPFGTRGGVSVEHYFPADGIYELDIGDLALAREVPNMEFVNTVVALLDGVEFYRTEVGGEEDHKWIDQILDDAVASINNRLKKIRFNATAGQHSVTVTFLQRSFAESDDRSRELALEGGQDRIHAISAIQVRGPLEVTGMSDTPSRQKIFTCYPREISEESACAEQILTNLAERAFRRPVTTEDSSELMAFYDRSRKDKDFEGSIEDALSAVLVSPHFLYRAEEGLFDKDQLHISDFELASRLSFFIWSSLPDETLLTLANNKELSKPEVLQAQVSRMLKDERAKTLVTDFASQWLNLPKLDQIDPNFGLFRYAAGALDPRPMLKTELNLFIESVMLSDQPITRLLDADYTFLNERLAMHYGIEDVKGSRFRKVKVDDPMRHGLLGKGALLMLTANPNRTSPVLRGAWIMERMLGTPPPSPPPGVDTNLSANEGDIPTTLRARLEKHRENPTCFGCHGVMDPLGLAFENFNTVGQFRSFDPDTLGTIDATGVLPDGTPINGPADVNKALLAKSDMFVQTITENLMTYALGRAVDYRDMPAVRSIVRTAAKNDNRFESIVYNIVMSKAFQMRDNYLSSSSEASEQQASL